MEKDYFYPNKEEKKASNINPEQAGYQLFYILKNAQNMTGKSEITRKEAVQLYEIETQCENVRNSLLNGIEGVGYALSVASSTDEMQQMILPRDELRNIGSLVTTLAQMVTAITDLQMDARYNLTCKQIKPA